MNVDRHSQQSVSGWEKRDEGAVYSMVWGYKVPNVHGEASLRKRLFMLNPLDRC